MTPQEILNEYEANTGHVIVETFSGLNAAAYSAVLVASHGPFTWGKDARDAIHNASLLEYVAQLACVTEQINPSISSMQRELHDKHFSRKHGPKAYYGQT